MKIQEILNDHRLRLLKKYVDHALDVSKSYYQSIDETNDFDKKISITKKYHHWSRRLHLYILFYDKRREYLEKLNNEELRKYRLRHKELLESLKLNCFKINNQKNVDYSNMNISM